MNSLLRLSADLKSEILTDKIAALEMDRNILLGHIDRLNEKIRSTTDNFFVYGYVREKQEKEKRVEEINKELEKIYSI